MISKNGVFISLIMMFVVVIIGVSFLSTSSDTISKLTDTYSAVNDSFAGIKDSGVEVIDPAIYSIVAVSSVKNATGATVAAGSGYNLTTDNQIEVYTANGTYYAWYTYRSVDYIDDDASRSMSDLIPMFFAIAILLSVIGYVAWKDFFDF